jgi:hypothetical protein
MFRLIIILFLTIFISSSDCRNESIILPELSLCLKDKYIIPLYSTRFFRMTFNRTRLKQLNIHTIHIRTLITDPKVANFDDHRTTVKQIFHLMNNTERK